MVAAYFHLFDTLKNTRHQHKICAKPHKKAIFSANFLGMAPKIYNNLPNILLQMNNINIFKKKRMFNILANEAFYSIKEYLNKKDVTE